MSINQAYIDVVSDIGCQQIIDFLTRHQNILDIFIINRPSLICKSTSLPGLSDHDVVLVDSNIIPQRRKPVCRLIHIWSKADIPAMEKEMSEFASEFRNTHSPSTHVNTMWMDIKRKCNKVITTHVPSKYTSTRFSQPWCIGTYADVAGVRSEPTCEPDVLKVPMTGIASANSRWKTRRPARMRITPM